MRNGILKYFCQYRKFWTTSGNDVSKISFEDFQKVLLKEISDNDDKYESIILPSTIYKPI